MVMQARIKAGTMSGESLFYDKALEIVNILDGAFDTKRPFSSNWIYWVTAVTGKFLSSISLNHKNIMNYFVVGYRWRFSTPPQNEKRTLAGLRTGALFWLRLGLCTWSSPNWVIIRAMSIISTGWWTFVIFYRKRLDQFVIKTKILVSWGTPLSERQTRACPGQMASIPITSTQPRSNGARNMSQLAGWATPFTNIW